MRSYLFPIHLTLAVFRSHAQLVFRSRTALGELEQRIFRLTCRSTVTRALRRGSRPFAIKCPYVRILARDDLTLYPPEVSGG